MKSRSKLPRTLQALLIAAASIFALAPAHAADPVQVTADNYVRAESDFQMKGYIEKLDCFGKFHHNREPYDVNNQVTVRELTVESVKERNRPHDQNEILEAIDEALAGE